MIDTLRLTAEEALGLIEQREVSAEELHGAYAAAAGERNEELHAYLRLVDYDGGTGVPIALEDVFANAPERENDLFRVPPTHGHEVTA